MTPDDDKPLTTRQARQKLQKGLIDYLAGNDPGPIVFRLKRTKKACETHPLKLTRQQRETLLRCTHLSRYLKKKITQAGEGTQIVGVTRNQLDQLNDETGMAAAYARSADQRRLMAVQAKVIKFFEDELAEVFDGISPKTLIPGDRADDSVEDRRMTHSKNKSGFPRFRVGDKVRVKYGVIDPDFSDIPLGGWAGAVKEVHQAEGETTLLVAWDRATLRGMHPIYKKRCERDGLEPESMWLGDEDLEPNDGTPVVIERPTGIVTKPLSEKDQDDRVRMALGLTHDDPLPEVSRKTLLAYHSYLAARLKFPFKVRSEADGMPMTIQSLLDPKECDLDEDGVALRGPEPSGAIRHPAVGSRGRRGESQAGRGLLLLVSQLAVSQGRS